MDNSKVYIRELQDVIWNHAWQIVSGSNEIEVETKAVTGVIKITKQYLLTGTIVKTQKLVAIVLSLRIRRRFLWRNLQERVFIDID